MRKGSEIVWLLIIIAVVSFFNYDVKTLPIYGSLGFANYFPILKSDYHSVRWEGMIILVLELRTEVQKIGVTCYKSKKQLSESYDFVHSFIL